ncbi:unnamed protein product [Diabrotica balteata]|uniref:Transmembrane protein n=1 Tax=Diabrotica balteata TaxID=107213 RepID=A0A9N9SPU2_DIABA|nr:unnamed protein product [Diabrotica balteata]
MSGAVYQPTTVTYESNGPHDRWQDRPISYLTSPGPQSSRRPQFIPLGFLSASITALLGGVYIFIIGIQHYLSTADAANFIYIVFGPVFIGIGIFLLVWFLRISRLLCWRNPKDHLDTSGGQALTVNPSTDLLVTAQYAPISEIAYRPSAPLEDTEQSKLMPQKNKDLSNEDTDRMVERDPRIVLRPLNTTEET